MVGGHIRSCTQCPSKGLQSEFMLVIVKTGDHMLIVVKRRPEGKTWRVVRLVSRIQVDMDFIESEYTSKAVPRLWVRFLWFQPAPWVSLVRNSDLCPIYQGHLFFQKVTYVCAFFPHPLCIHLGCLYSSLDTHKCHVLRLIGDSSA